MPWTDWYPHTRPGDPPVPDGFQYRYRQRSSHISSTTQDTARANGETGHYVSLSVPDSVTDTELLDTIAKRLDVELATRKYDSLFGR